MSQVHDVLHVHDRGDVSHVHEVTCRKYMRCRKCMNRATDLSQVHESCYRTRKLLHLRVP